MIISRAPLRISLGGGGTDLPSYYREHGGYVLSAAIDKYVYITLHETFQREYLIKYSSTEVVQKIDEIKHPIIREALRLVPVAAPHLEIVSMSDIPAGTGLGSSGSFTVVQAFASSEPTAILPSEWCLGCCGRGSWRCRSMTASWCHNAMKARLGRPWMQRSAMSFLGDPRVTDSPFKSDG